MRSIYKPGDSKSYSFKVTDAHFPDFGNSIVHDVCATYTLAKEIEWASRLFVLDMLQKNEEGIGTLITIEHVNPAFLNEQVCIKTIVMSLKGHELLCSYVASVGSRIIAKGRTGQKILEKRKLISRFSTLEQGGKK